MRPSLIFATFATTVAAVCATLAAPPGIATADDTARDTIAGLQAEGYSVNVDRVGSAPLEDCVVSNIRNRQIRTEYVRDYHGSRDEDGNRRSRLREVVVSKTVSVSLVC